MALDGIVISNIVHELATLLVGGRVDKIYQPEKDEISMAIRSGGKNYKLLLTANASHPRVHFSEIQKDNPQTAPLFCMVMRKQVAGGRIISISQPNFERIVNIQVESANELGDFTVKTLIIEIMGKHSNIILVDEDGRILDSIKHISHDTSSVREVLPGREYVLPPSQGKMNPLTELESDSFFSLMDLKSDYQVQKVIYTSYSGISPIVASEICHRAGVYQSERICNLSDEERRGLYNCTRNVFNDIKNALYKPQLIFEAETEKVKDFSSVDLTLFTNDSAVAMESASAMLESFFQKKDSSYRIQQKTTDLRKLVNVNIERCVKKKDIQQKTYRDVSEYEKWRLYGELITANIYAIEPGMSSLVTTNFYDENMSEISIPIDRTLTPSGNAQRYFNKYNKAKRTLAALAVQTAQNDEELLYLEGVLNSIEACQDEADIAQIREELSDQGFVKKKKNKKDEKIKKAKPLHFKSVDGFDIYVGKNNKQNDELTLQFATGNDIWLHTKDIPGSHVIVKSDNKTVPGSTLNEAAHLAAYYSKGKDSAGVAVDYTIKKNVKKPNGAKPGMVIYEHNKTAYVTPDEAFIKKIMSCQ